MGLGLFFSGGMGEPAHQAYEPSLGEYDVLQRFTVSLTPGGESRFDVSLHHSSLIVRDDLSVAGRITSFRIVPEPSSLALVTLGTVALLRVGRRPRPGRLGDRSRGRWMRLGDISIQFDGRTYIVYGTTFLASSKMVQSRFEVDTSRPDPLVGNLCYIDGTWYRGFEPAALERLGTSDEKARPFRRITNFRRRSREPPPYAEGQEIHGQAGDALKGDLTTLIPRMDSTLDRLMAIVDYAALNIAVYLTIFHWTAPELSRAAIGSAAANISIFSLLVLLPRDPRATSAR